MQVLGFTINLLTLLAIVLSVGLVVDDAIVVVENVERHLSEGQSPARCSPAGCPGAGGPHRHDHHPGGGLYAPIGLQGGLTGSLFREFAFTLAGAVTISGVVALTLSPMMSSKLLAPGMSERGFAGKISRGFKRFTAFYGRLLDATLNARPAVYTVWIVVSWGWPFPCLSCHPRSWHQPRIRGWSSASWMRRPMPPWIRTSRNAAAANDVFMSMPETQFTFQVTSPSSGFGGMVVAPWGERERSVFDILPEVQHGLNQIPGIRMFAVTPPPLPGGGQFPVEFVLAATEEPENILRFAQQLQLKAIQSGMFAFPPSIDVKIDQPQSEIVLDRDKVADLGLNLQQVGGDLASHGGRQLRQPLQHRWPQLQSHPPDPAR
jgi:multidrug efflux pump